MTSRVIDMGDIASLVSRHDEWRLRECLNLQCSENVTSEAVRRLLSSDMGHRYTLPFNQEVHGSFVRNAYRGTKYMDEVEERGSKIAAKLFGGKFVTLKPLSGHIAGMIMLMATCKRGDRILIVDANDGGYDGYLPSGMAWMLGLKVGSLPFDVGRWNIDTDAASKKILKYRPRLVVLGASFILFPYDIEPLKEAANKVGAVIGYDGSHVLGLIAGGEFQDPLGEGADILTGSTHKSFFGPQGGLVICKDEELFNRVQETFRWRVMDNAHWNRIAALSQALSESERCGQRYARQVVRNAKALAKEFDSRGLPVRFRELGYTECHQMHLDEETIKEAFGLTMNQFADKLERQKVIVDAVGRIGPNEVTRMGLKEGDMATVAGMVMDCLAGRNVGREHARLRSRMRLQYC